MPSPNIDPIYTKTGGLAAAVLSNTNSASDGSGSIGSSLFLLATLDANVGGFVRAVEFWPTTTSSGTAMSTTAVGRVFWSTKTSGVCSSADTHLIGEMILAPQTPANNAAAIGIVLPINHPFPPGASILASITLLPTANTAWQALLKYGSY